MSLAMEESPEIIDLTASYTYCRAKVNLSCSVIVLDDSIGQETHPAPSAPTQPIVIEGEADDLPEVNVSPPKKFKATKKQRKPRTIEATTSSVRERTPHYGDCPICRDSLGIKPMASTKCGHVYCIGCIEQAVRIEKKCPTCRKPLKGATAFHPLFL